MLGSKGDWRASPENLSHAQTVLDAVADSGTLYRDGLGMIASENIVSPMVQKIVSSDLHGRYAEGLPFNCLLYTSPSPRDRTRSRMPSSA